MPQRVASKKLLWLVAVAGMLVTALIAATTRNSGRFDAEVAAYETADRAHPPPANPALFFGASTFRLWGKQLEDDFKSLNAINRGIGGAYTDDLLHYFDRMVLKYRPKMVVIYCGENDIAEGKSPEHAVANLKAFIERIRRELGDVPVFYISSKPSQSRWAIWDKINQVNEEMRAYAKEKEKVFYIDTTKVMLGKDGKPNAELFRADKLHMNRQGQELWIPIVRKAIEEAVR